MSALIDRYRNNSNVVFGIWNEPNLSSFGAFSPAQYQTLFQIAAEARDATNYNARLAGPETSSGVTTYFNDALGRIRQYMHPSDVVTLHWYFDGPYIINEMQNAVNQAQGREVWLSEVGSKTCSDADQAADLNLLMQYFGTNSSGWTKVFWFQLHSGDPGNCDESIMTAGWSPRAAYFMYRDQWINRPHFQLRRDERLYPNEELVSLNREYVLVYQGDGNLVVYRGSTPVWASSTAGTSPGFAVMQGDGNFVVNDGSGTPVFNTGTAGNVNAYLEIANNGQLQVWRQDALLWTNW